MKVLNSIKSLGITIEQLYKAETKQINIILTDKSYVFSVVLKDHRGIDCKISSFGANLYARTNKGVKYEKYKTLATLQSALVRLVKSKIETNGDLKFELSDKVYTI